MFAVRNGNIKNAEAAVRASEKQAAKEVAEAVAARDRFEKIFSDPEDITRAFHAIDVDGSGSVDLDELAAGLSSLEVLGTQKADITHLFQRYDIDGSGRLDAIEFADLVESRRAALDRAVSPSRPFLADASTSRPRATPFMLPSAGKATIVYNAMANEVVLSGNDPDEAAAWLRRYAKAQIARAHQTTPPRGVKRLLSMVLGQGGGTDRSAMLLMALPYMRLRADEALELHSALVAELGDSTRALAAELPQCATPFDARLLVSTYAPTPTQKRLLRQKLGPEYPIIMGQYTGRFELNLNEPTHQRALDRILIVNDNEKLIHTAAGGADVSQCGAVDREGGDCFRNPLLDHEPIQLCSCLFEEEGKDGSPPPSKEHGRVTFDYVSPTAAGESATPLTRKHFLAVCKQLNIKASTSSMARVKELEKRQKLREKAVRQRHIDRPRETKLNAFIDETTAVPSNEASLDVTLATSPSENRPPSPDGIGIRPRSAQSSRPGSAQSSRPGSARGSRPSSAQGSRPSSPDPASPTRRTNAEISLSLCLTGSAPETYEVFQCGTSSFAPVKPPLKPKWGCKIMRRKASKRQKEEAAECEKILSMANRPSLQSEFTGKGKLVSAPKSETERKLRGAILKVRSQTSITSAFTVKSSKSMFDLTSDSSVPAPSPPKLSGAEKVARPVREKLREQNRVVKNPERPEATAFKQAMIDPKSPKRLSLLKMCKLLCIAAEIRNRAATRIEAWSALVSAQDELIMHWFSAMQARQFVLWFPTPELPPGNDIDFNPLVELVVALHPRVVDRWSFDTTLSSLNVDERGQAIERLGCVFRHKTHTHRSYVFYSCCCTQVAEHVEPDEARWILQS